MKNIFRRQAVGNYEENRSNIVLNEENWFPFLLRSGTEQGHPVSPFLCNVTLNMLASAIPQGKKTFKLQGKKLELFLFKNYMTTCVENPMECTKKAPRTNS